MTAIRVVRGGVVCRGVVRIEKERRSNSCEIDRRSLVFRPQNVSIPKCEHSEVRKSSVVSRPM